MDIKLLSKKRRHVRVRKRVRGSSERPRLAVFRSNKHIYAQIIDDNKGATLAAASSLTEEFKKSGKKPSDKDGAFLVGELLAKLAVA